jgi:inosose dehydratase
MLSRKNFLQLAGLSLVGLPKSDGLPRQRGASGQTGGAGAPLPLQMGIAGYTFLHVPVDQGIAMMKRVGVSALSIKDFYLPLDSGADVIGAVTGKFSAAGIKIYAAGVIYMKTQQEVDKAFAYAKALGVDLIRVAIHNHGPEDKLYPSPVDVYTRVKVLDERIGLCLDIGHAARAGADPAKVVREYGSRIFDLHIKDLAVISREAKPIELGRGVLDIPGLVRALIKIRYAGYCSIEHEMDMNDPLPGVAESAGYFRGVQNGEV